MKAGIYCRLSEEDQNKLHAEDDSASIQNQKTLLCAYAAEQGWEIYEIYSDDDYAGADRKRPAFNRLLKDAENRKLDVVLCKSQSRFTRELELVEKYIHGLFPLWGVRFVGIADHADTAIEGNKKSRQINGLVNEWYLEDMSDNIRVVLTNRRQNGYHIGAFALYGYRKDPAHKGRLLIDEEAAAVVREVFLLFSQGYGKTAIARLLNSRGVPNPTEYKRLHGQRYQPPTRPGGTLWKYQAIASMLVNEMYIGNMVQGKYGSVSYKTKQNRPRPKEQWYRVEGTHEAIIDQALWERVQTLIMQRAKPFSGGEIGLFARKTRCMNCGYTMRSCRTAEGRRYLQCPSRHIAKDACPGSFIAVDRLEQYVLTELNRLLPESLDQDELQRCAKPRTGLLEERKVLHKSCEAARQKAEEYTIGLRELYLDKVRGLLSEADYLAFSSAFTAERERLGKAVLDCEARLSSLSEALEDPGPHTPLLTRNGKVQQLDREMVDLLIDHILVGRRIAGTQDVPVTIYWDF